MNKTLDDLRKFVEENNIEIDDKCWSLFVKFLSSQLAAIGSVCIEYKLINNDLATQTQKCLKETIPKYDELIQIIHSLNPHKHGFFTTPFTEMYLVLAYIALIRNDTKKLNITMLSFAAYMLTMMFRKFFRVCQADRLQMAVSYLSGKSIYKKFNLNHVEVIKYVVLHALKLHAQNDDKVFKWMRNIRSHINQLLKTLAQAYYKTMDSTSHYGAAHDEVDVNQVFLIFKQQLETSLDNIELLANKLNVDLSEDMIDCIKDNVSVNDLHQIFSYLIKKSDSNKSLILSYKVCKQQKTLFNKILSVFDYDDKAKKILQDILTKCNIGLKSRSQVKKLLSFIITVSWIATICET